MNCGRTKKTVWRGSVGKTLPTSALASSIAAAPGPGKGRAAAVTPSGLLCFVAPIFAVLALILLATPPQSAQADVTPPFAEAAEHYDQGRLDEAIAIYRTLAEDGVAAAQVSLAGLYAGGEVAGEPDPARAFQWYEAAAKQGDSVGQLNLGDMYARGRGVERDSVEAWVWLSLAAEQGRAWAEQRRSSLEERMTDDDRALAEQRLAGRRERLDVP